MARSVVRAAVRAVVSLGLMALLGAGLALATGQLRTVTLLSGSMSPHRTAGTLVVERPANASDIRSGDVITFHTPTGGDLVTHRVVRVFTENGQLLATTKGDANDKADAWQVVLSGEPVWREVWHLPGAGRLDAALHRNSQLLLVASLGFPLLLLATWLRAIWSPPEEAPA